ncbi:TrmB family transcriptional regulator [candidate division KSB1 bacterium]
MTLEILRKIGLSEGEIKVYSALLETGKAPVNKVHERTGIERRNIYDILNKLIERGLVTYITENKRRLFRVSHPNKIMNYIEEKEENLGIIKKDIAKEIPTIIDKFNFPRSDVNAEFFRGIEGVKAVFEDMLNYKDAYWVGAGKWLMEKYPVWWRHWNKKRIEKKMVWHNLLIHERKLLGDKARKYEEIKFLPKEFSGNKTVFGIYGNKVINFMFGPDFLAFVIESKEFADNYRKYHKYLWDNVAED